MKVFNKDVIVQMKALDLSPEEERVLIKLLGSVSIETMMKHGLTEEEGHEMSRLFFMLVSGADGVFKQ